MTTQRQQELAVYLLGAEWANEGTILKAGYARRTLDVLIDAGLAEAFESPLGPWWRFRLTERGREFARGLARA